MVLAVAAQSILQPLGAPATPATVGGADPDTHGALHVTVVAELAVVVGAVLAELGVADPMDHVGAPRASARAVDGAVRVLVFRVAHFGRSVHVGHAMAVLAGVGGAEHALSSSRGAEAGIGAFGLLTVVVLAVCEEFAPW